MIIHVYSSAKNSLTVANIRVVWHATQEIVVGVQCYTANLNHVHVGGHSWDHQCCVGQLYQSVRISVVRQCNVVISATIHVIMETASAMRKLVWYVNVARIKLRLPVVDKYFVLRNAIRCCHVVMSVADSVIKDSALTRSHSMAVLNRVIKFDNLVVIGAISDAISRFYALTYHAVLRYQWSVSVVTESNWWSAGAPM